MTAAFNFTLNQLTSPPRPPSPHLRGCVLLGVAQSERSGPPPPLTCEAVSCWVRPSQRGQRWVRVAYLNGRKRTGVMLGRGMGCP